MLVATRVPARPWPQLLLMTFPNLPRRLADRVEQTQSAADTGPGLWQDPSSTIPAFMFALQHLDSFKAPTNVMCRSKGKEMAIPAEGEDVTY